MKARSRLLALLVAVLCVVGWAPALDRAQAASAEVTAPDGPGVLPGRRAVADVAEVTNDLDDPADLPSRLVALPAFERAMLASIGGGAAEPEAIPRTEPGLPRGPPRSS